MVWLKMTIVVLYDGPLPEPRAHVACVLATVTLASPHTRVVAPSPMTTEFTSPLPTGPKFVPVMVATPPAVDTEETALMTGALYENVVDDELVDGAAQPWA